MQFSTLNTQSIHHFGISQFYATFLLLSHAIVAIKEKFYCTRFCIQRGQSDCAAEQQWRCAVLTVGKWHRGGKVTVQLNNSGVLLWWQWESDTERANSLCSWTTVVLCCADSEDVTQRGQSDCAAEQQWCCAVLTVGKWHRGGKVTVQLNNSGVLLWWQWGSDSEGQSHSAAEQPWCCTVLTVWKSHTQNAADGCMTPVTQS